jgi:hypothetical protein
VDSAYGSITISAENGTLQARYDKLEMGALEHWSFDTFRARPRRLLDDPPTLAFQPDGAGSVESVRVFGNVFVRKTRP